MAANIREEFRRFQRRKQLQFHPQPSSGDSSDMEAPSSPSNQPASSTPLSHSSSGKEKLDKPLFTFKQVEYSLMKRKELAYIDRSSSGWHDL